jgi:hypothetical protein
VPLSNFDGETFVAYLDISGFKELMKRKNAWKALDVFYSSGYNSLQLNPSVEGFFVSDCGVLFVRSNASLLDKFSTLLKVIREINLKMTTEGFMLKSSIAYGRFTYRNRIEFSGIEKNPIYGNAYMSAVIDNEDTKPKIEPTQCRIVKANFPLTLDQLRVNNSITELICERKNDSKHYYFYWMVNEPSIINDFEKLFHDAYQLKYAGMLNAAKTFAVNSGNPNQLRR